MKLTALGIYREIEFSPGKVSADRSIMDAVLANLRRQGVDTTAIAADAFVSTAPSAPHLALAMCQSAGALKNLAALESSGTVVINSALGIRNCYRDLLGPGLIGAGVPTPQGCVVRTAYFDGVRSLGGLDHSTPMFVKRGDLHALGPEDVQRVEGMSQLEQTLSRFHERGIESAYVQQEASGQVVKFYGVGSNAEYFAAASLEGEAVEGIMRRRLGEAAAGAARALGVEVWGGDAIIQGEDLSIVDFNDWPSFSRVIVGAAEAIAAYALQRTQQGSKLIARGRTRQFDSLRVSQPH